MTRQQVSGTAARLRLMPWAATFSADTSRALSRRRLGTTIPQGGDDIVAAIPETGQKTGSARSPSSPTGQRPLPVPGDRVRQHRQRPARGRRLAVPLIQARCPGRRHHPRLRGGPAARQDPPQRAADAERGYPGRRCDLPQRRPRGVQLHDPGSQLHASTANARRSSRWNCRHDRGQWPRPQPGVASLRAGPAWRGRNGSGRTTRAAGFPHAVVPLSRCGREASAPGRRMARAGGQASMVSMILSASALARSEYSEFRCRKTAWAR